MRYLAGKSVVFVLFACMLALAAFVLLETFLTQPAAGLAVQGVFLCAACGFAYACRSAGQSKAERRAALRARLSLYPLPFKEGVLVALAALLFMPALSVLFGEVYRLFPGYDAYTKTAQGFFTALGERQGFFMLFCMMVFLPAFCEELFFRGFVTAVLREGGFRPCLVIVLVGLVFALFHLDPWRFFPVFAIGMIMTWLVILCRSICAPLVYHFVNNGLIFLISVLGSSGERSPALAETDVSVGMEQVFAALFMAALGVVALIHLARLARSRAQKSENAEPFFNSSTSR
jgi:membrane protease YdiL (CAAX protease family)